MAHARVLTANAEAKEWIMEEYAYVLLKCNKKRQHYIYWVVYRIHKVGSRLRNQI